MIIELDRIGTTRGIQDAVQKIQDSFSVKSFLIFSCAENQFTPETINPVLETIPVPVFGGIFPSIIHGNEKLNQGSIIIGLPVAPEIAVINNLSSDDEDFISQIETKAGKVEKTETIFVFVDGFSSRIDSFINSLFTIFGLENNYIGGGTGSLDMISKPSLFTNSGLCRDAAVLACFDLKSGVGVSHGWQSVSGPYRVTSSVNNTIQTLDWEPAWQVYSKAVEEHSNVPIRKDDFFSRAKAYPFGIAKLEAERIVRDPIMVSDDGAITCVGDVPEGSFVDLLHSDEAALISAAGRAKKLGIEAFGEGREIGAAFFIDCISRVLFLEERFTEEIRAVLSETYPLVGACTIGEIANNGREYLEFYNKTSVVAVLEKI